MGENHIPREDGPMIRVRRGGITLIEVVVVLAIIGFLFALFMPAVDVVRKQADRRVECWLATTNYAGNWLVFKTGDNRFPAAIPDGTSNTIGFTERYQVCNGTPCGWGYDRVYYWAPMTAYYSDGKFQVTPRDR